MSKRILVTLSDKQYAELKKEETLGDTDAEKLRNAWMIFMNVKELLKAIDPVPLIDNRKTGK